MLNSVLKALVEKDCIRFHEDEDFIIAYLRGNLENNYSVSIDILRESQRIAVWILCAVAPIGVYFCYLGIAVARNPERYSKKVRRLFYKDGYLH